VRLSLRKVACSSVVPTTSTGNPASVCTNCETAYAVNSALRRRRPRGAQECCGQAEPFNLMSPYRFGSPSHHAPKRRCLPGGGGRCTGRAHRCKAKQGRRGKAALTSGSYSHNSTVFGRRREGKKISLVTTTGRCFFIIAQRGDCRCGRLLTCTQSRGRNLGVVPASERPGHAASMDTRWLAVIRNRADCMLAISIIGGGYGSVV
jgi:hypothetical protein